MLIVLAESMSLDASLASFPRKSLNAMKYMDHAESKPMEDLPKLGIGFWILCRFRLGCPLSRMNPYSARGA